MVEESNIAKRPEEMRGWKGMNGGEHKILVEHAYNKCQNEIVGLSTTKRISLIWTYRGHLKIMIWQLATHGKKNWIDMDKETRNLFHREDK